MNTKITEIYRFGPLNKDAVEYESVRCLMVNVDLLTNAKIYAQKINSLVLVIDLSLQLTSVLLVRHGLERGMLGHHRGLHGHHVRISTVTEMG
jgi:hypothetical protein